MRTAQDIPGEYPEPKGWDNPDRDTTGQSSPTGAPGTFNHLTDAGARPHKRVWLALQKGLLGLTRRFCLAPQKILLGLTKGGVCLAPQKGGSAWPYKKILLGLTKGSARPHKRVCLARRDCMLMLLMLLMLHAHKDRTAWHAAAASSDHATGVTHVLCGHELLPSLAHVDHASGWMCPHESRGHNPHASCS